MDNDALKKVFNGPFETQFPVVHLDKKASADFYRELYETSQMIGKRSQANWFKDTDFRYSSVHDLVCKHADMYESARLINSEHQGRKQSCFNNSGLLTSILHSGGHSDADYYVEGYAVHAESGLPMHHAWVEDCDGSAVETTWDELGAAYFGVRFEPLYVIKRALDRGYFGLLDDWRNDFFALKSKLIWECEELVDTNGHGRFASRVVDMIKPEPMTEASEIEDEKRWYLKRELKAAARLQEFDEYV